MSRITIYTTQFCGYCRAAKQLLAAKGLEFDEVSVDWDADLRQEMTQRSGGRHTVPQIFIDGTHVGGFQELAALERESRLDAWVGGAPNAAEPAEAGGEAKA
jgi:glutaredoxin 3